MKHAKDLLSGLLALSLLCCACSGGGSAETPDFVPGNAVQLAQADGSAAFADIPAGAWYANAANWCRDHEVMSGTASGVFSPNETMTHAMLLTMLYRHAGSPSAENSSGTWYGRAVSWSAEKGLTADYDGGRLDPLSPVTREQIAAILWRYAGSPEAGASEDFADEGSISAYAQTAVDWARNYSIMNGTEGGRFDPKATTTRAQTVMVLYNYLSGAEDSAASGTAAETVPEGAAAVYMTTDISSAGLMKIYNALNRPATGEKVAVKLSMGEPGGHNFLQPALIQELVQTVNGTIVDSNTAYGGRRASTALHYQTAEDHGFTAIAPVQILDEDGDARIPVTGGERLTENIVGGHFTDYDFYVVLSHFKGHAMGGFGGAVKNISIGISSPAGKMLQHSGGHSESSWGGGTQDEFLEAMAEAAKSVDDYLGDNILYISVMNNLSVDCDCDSNPAAPDMHDIGILASTDPVALDQACVDFVYAAEDGQSLVSRIESCNGIHALEHAEKIGFGSRDYQIVSIDG